MQHIDKRHEPLTEVPLHKVTCEEVGRQLNKIQNGKSCGPDGIPTEALKHISDRGVCQLNLQCNHAKRQDARWVERERESEREREREGERERKLTYL